MRNMQGGRNITSGQVEYNRKWEEYYLVVKEYLVEEYNLQTRGISSVERIHVSLKVVGISGDKIISLREEYHYPLRWEEYHIQASGISCSLEGMSRPCKNIFSGGRVKLVD